MNMALVLTNRAHCLAQARTAIAQRDVAAVRELYIWLGLVTSKRFTEAQQMLAAWRYLTRLVQATGQSMTDYFEGYAQEIGAV